MSWKSCLLTLLLMPLIGCVTTPGQTGVNSTKTESLRPGYYVVYHPKIRPDETVGSANRTLHNQLFHSNFGSNLLKYNIVVEKKSTDSKMPYKIFLKGLYKYSGDDLSDAEKTADALYFLQQDQKKVELAREKEKSNQRKELDQFKLIADKYRKLKTKPLMSEEQRKYRVEGGTLVKLKEYGRAKQEFLKVIEINPTSCTGVYLDLAYLAANERHFDTAIFRMKEYLLLVPNNKDARKYQDEIYEWEAMAEN